MQTPEEHMESVKIGLRIAQEIAGLPVKYSHELPTINKIYGDIESAINTPDWLFELLTKKKLWNLRQDVRSHFETRSGFLGQQNPNIAGCSGNETTATEYHKKYG